MAVALLRYTQLFRSYANRLIRISAQRQIDIRLSEKVLRIQLIDILGSHKLHRRIHGSRNRLLMQNVQCELKHTLPVALGKEGDGANETRCWDSQFSPSCRNRAKSNRQTKTAASGLFERAQCPKYGKIIDASQQSSSLRCRLQVFPGKLKCSDKLSTRLELSCEPVSR